MSESSAQRFNRILLFSAAGITFLLQILLIFNINVWQDEVMTLDYITQPWPDMMRTLVGDVHPPLYYLLLKILISIFGYHFILVKAFSAVPVALMHLWVSILILKDNTLKNQRAAGILGALFILVTTCSANFTYLTTEIRMYSLCMFFVTLSGIYAFRLSRAGKKKDAVLFYVMSMGAAYTHYYGAVAAAVIFLYLLIYGISENHRFLKKWVLLVLLCIAGYIPWMPALFSQVSRTASDYWITFRFTDILNYCNYVFDTTDPFQVILFGAILLTALYSVFCRKDRSSLLWGLAFLALPYLVALVGVIASLAVRPVFVTRYLSPCLGLFWAGVMMLLYHSDYRKILSLAAAILILWLSLNGYVAALGAEYDTGTEDTIAFMERESRPGQILSSDNVGLRTALLHFYFPDCTCQSITDYDFVTTFPEEPVWFFADSTRSFDPSYITDAGYEYRPAYSGNFDSKYFFTIYLIVKEQ